MRRDVERSALGRQPRATRGAREQHDGASGWYTCPRPGAGGSGVPCRFGSSSEALVDSYDTRREMLAPRKARGLTLTKLLCRRRTWWGLRMAELPDRWPPSPLALGMRQTMTVLSMLQDATMESSGDLHANSSRGQSAACGFPTHPHPHPVCVYLPWFSQGSCHVQPVQDSVSRHLVFVVRCLWCLGEQNSNSNPSTRLGRGDPSHATFLPDLPSGGGCHSEIEGENLKQGTGTTRAHSLQQRLNHLQPRMRLRSTTMASFEAHGFQGWPSLSRQG